MSILVTGAAGFIGCNNVLALNERGITDIIAVDNLERGEKYQNLAKCSISDYFDKRDFIARVRDGSAPKPEAIFHQGACSDTMEHDGKYMMENNYRYTLELYRWAQELGIPFIYASSAATYGAHQEFIEDVRYEGPLNVYGYSKYLFDQVLRRELKSLRAPVIGLRYFNVFGQRQDPYGAYAAVIPQWFAALTKGDTVYVNGDGETSRDFCYIDNVVQANLLASYAAEDARDLVYNVAFGQRTTLNELFRLIRDEVVRHKPEAAEAKPAAKPAVLKPRADGGMLREITPRPQQAGNPYKPMLATVVETIQETGNIKTLRVVLDDPDQMANFTYEPGQVGQLSVFGAGESTFVINTPPSQKEYLQFSVMQAGEVTSAIHRLSPGDKVGVRAPLGNFFPYNDWKGKNIFFVGGGIGMAPIRTIMLHVLEHKADYGKVSLLYGARSPRDMAFSYELEGWLANPDLDCTLCIDNPYEGWPHKVGLIPNVLTELNPSPDNCVAVLCGPPIMIKFTLQALEKLGFQPENIVTTLEKRMKCGIGICGRCNIGSHYVCVDGPVFTMAQLKELPPEL